MRSRFPTIQVHFLHGEAKKIESAMATTQTEISEQEKDIGRLQGKLQRIGSMDSLYVSSYVRYVICNNLQITQVTNHSICLLPCCLQ